MKAPTSDDLLAAYRERVELALQRWLPGASIPPATLHQAMRYMTLGAGKRLRPLLVYSTGAALGVPAAHLDAPAAAVELIHSYSLVHDDLPAMDNDDLRRGQPTCHRAFDEATAILVGDALQVLAFQILAREAVGQTGPAERLQMIAELAEASGTAGMAGGQAIDLAATGQQLGLDDLEAMHRLKTGALIRACVRLGALACPTLEPAQFAALTRYAECIGLAFQIRDDILDEEGDAAVIGKQPGADRARHKPTYTTVLGVREAKRRARALYEQSAAALDSFDAAADTLRDIARYVVDRVS